MNDYKETEKVCEECNGTGLAPDYEWDENLNGWLQVDEHPCHCVIQKLDEENANE